MEADAVPTAGGVDREAQILCMYLGGVAPTDYVRTCFRRGRQSIPPIGRPPDTLDHALDATVRMAPWAVSLADAYASVLRPVTPLRHKVVLMLAILENAPESHEDIDKGLAASRWGSLLVVGAIAARAGAKLAAASLIFGPIHLIVLMRHAIAGAR